MAVAKASARVPVPPTTLEGAVVIAVEAGNGTSEFKPSPAKLLLVNLGIFLRKESRVHTTEGCK
jgi:hypothetical protein